MESEFHKQQLLKHCRVCGKRLCKAKGRAPVFDCSDHSSDLLTSFGVDVSGAGADQHVFPPKFCNPCFATLNKDKKARKIGIPRVHLVTPFTWTEHTPNCPVRKYKNNPQSLHVFCRFVCTLIPSLEVGGRIAR